MLPSRRARKHSNGKSNIRSVPAPQQRERPRSAASTRSSRSTGSSRPASARSFSSNRSAGSRPQSAASYRRPQSASASLRRDQFSGTMNQKQHGTFPSPSPQRKKQPQSAWFDPLEKNRSPLAVVGNAADTSSIGSNTTNSKTSTEDQMYPNEPYTKLASVLTDQLRGAKSIKEVFLAWDQDKDGVISKQEFCSVMHRMGINISKYETDAVFDKIDLDGSGCRYNGFLRLVTGGKPYSSAEKRQWRHSATTGGECVKRDFATCRGKEQLYTRSHKPVGWGVMNGEEIPAAGGKGVIGASISGAQVGGHKKQQNQNKPGDKMEAEMVVPTELSDMVKNIRKKFSMEPLRKHFLEWNTDNDKKDANLDQKAMQGVFYRMGFPIPDWQMNLLFQRFSSNGRSLCYRDFVQMVGKSGQDDEFTDDQRDRRRIPRTKQRVTEPVAKREASLRETRKEVAGIGEPVQPQWQHVEIPEDDGGEGEASGDRDRGRGSSSANVNPHLRQPLRSSTLQGRIQTKLQQNWNDIGSALHELQSRNQSFGRIENKEFKQVLYGLDVGFTPHELQVLVTAVDHECFGAIDYFDFARRVDAAHGNPQQPMSFFRRCTPSLNAKGVGLKEHEGKGTGRVDRRKAATERIIPSRASQAGGSRQSRRAQAFADQLKTVNRGAPPPTRYGLTDYHDTSRNITGDTNLPHHAGTCGAEERFEQTSWQYGGHEPSYAQEKRRTQQQYEKRLDRVRQNAARVDANNVDREKDEQAHERRVHALIRQRVQHYERLRGRVERDQRRQQVYIDAFS